MPQAKATSAAGGRRGVDVRLAPPASDEVAPGAHRIDAPVIAPARNPRELHEALARLKRRQPLRLGQALVALGLLDAEQLERAKHAKLDDPLEPLGVILRKLGVVDDEAVHAGLALQLGVPAADLDHWPFEPRVLQQLPAALARYYRALPVDLQGNTLFVAMSDVLDADVLDALRLGTPLGVQPVYAPAADIQRVLDRVYVDEPGATVSDEDLELNKERYTGEQAARLDERELVASDNVIVRLADQIIAEAHRDRASDIHVEPAPGRGKTLIRVRIDGQMFVRRSIPWVYRDALVSRLKVMANLNVAEHRVPQDGKILFRRAGSTPIELRMAVLPTAGGTEDVVLRILDTSTALPIGALGLAAEDHKRLIQIIEKPYGILLVCGPTGSGKTTTLHAVLHHLNDGTLKIWTVENPVEITQPGLRQVEVNPRAGLTFPGALRAFLRADPDVIMVGEIRDVETAKTALEASLTGHLVLSTLHTNNAPESILRLLEMGMSPFNFSDSLLGVLAQRLVRCLCKACREPFDASDEVLAGLAREHGGADPGALAADWRRELGADGRITLFRPKGCSECAGTGYKGRLGLFELMTATPEVKQAIIEGAPAARLFELALQQGMQTLKRDGIRKVLAGITDLPQVLAVSER
jgi:type II secretory ATPase GspE/PulE/Tfp pilus assembly ATPase PilB-like protein